ncbi:MAG: hypothetical protein DMG57_06775 [Acidobacteria bacterium]|nr:MAG: hypothetical protein DMG57_06775 [Acidobacteriota bacterium]
MVLLLFASPCIKYYIYILIALFLYMARGMGICRDRFAFGDMSRTASDIRQNVALTSLVLVVGSWHWLLSPVLFRVRTWHLAHGGRAGQIAFGSYMHQCGEKRVFPRDYDPGDAGRLQASPAEHASDLTAIGASGCVQQP